jgi:uncharacterized repeat protein (TIGR04076 family)
LTYHVGHRVIGTIKGTKGNCHAGHEIGQEIELDAHNSGGLCGFFYHDIFPYIVMLQFGGKFPDDWGGEVIEFECMDRYNAVTIELRRVGPYRSSTDKG